MEKLMTIEELVKSLPGIKSKKTVYNLRYNGEIPYQKIGKRLYFDRQEIEEWTKKRTLKFK